METMMPEIAGSEVLKLNLGCGQHALPGFVNVDKNGTPELRWDLEKTPWPWPDNSVNEVVLNHVLEHLGESAATFFEIVKELYRVCKHNAVIHITVTHPRHDDFLAEPTHVRAFTLDSFYPYSKARNREWQRDGSPNTPLAFYLDVDFNVASVQYDLEQPWAGQYDSKRISHAQLLEACKQFNNVVKKIRVKWVVNKPDAFA
jgi:hypothetical protein